MPLFSFKRRFVEPILNGTKDQTIRAVRKVPVRLHQVMHLYTGLRQPGAKLIGRVLCRAIYAIEMAPAVTGGWVSLQLLRPLDGIPGEPMAAYYAGDSLHDFARRDGFTSWPELCEFWREEHGELVEPFCGHVYRWDPRDIPR